MSQSEELGSMFATTEHFNGLRTVPKGKKWNTLIHGERRGWDIKCCFKILNVATVFGTCRPHTRKKTGKRTLQQLDSAQEKRSHPSDFIYTQAIGLGRVSGQRLKQSAVESVCFEGYQLKPSDFLLLDDRLCRMSLHENCTS